MKSTKRKDAMIERLEQTLDLPVGALVAAPRMELTGNRRLALEGCRQILECDEDHICLRTVIGTVRLTGRELRMDCRASEQAVISGQLLAVEFL